MSVEDPFGQLIFPGTPVWLEAENKRLWLTLKNCTTCEYYEHPGTLLGCKHHAELYKKPVNSECNYKKE
jgi:hypothetical protein